MVKGKGIAILAIVLLLMLALPGLAQTRIISAILGAGGFLANWPTQPSPAVAWAQLEAQQQAYGGSNASLAAITVRASETVPATIQGLTPWAVPGGAPPEPETRPPQSSEASRVMDVGKSVPSHPRCQATVRLAWAQSLKR